MGTEISDSDMAHIHSLCDQVISITAYRAQLYEYLRNRMNAIAPNLTALVGELVGARLISHAGSLLSLAKFPASTVQILGAEKALFRALKTKHDTPKYGLIYHASLIGQASPKLKGKMARMVATKSALAIRIDALTDSDGKSDQAAGSVGVENRAKLESRLRALEEQSELGIVRRFGDQGKKQQGKFEMKRETRTYNTQVAVQAVLDVKEEKRKAKEEKKARKKAEKGKMKEEEEEEEEEERMEVDGEEESKKKEKKRKRRESEANGEKEEKKSKKEKVQTDGEVPKKKKKKSE